MFETPESAVRPAAKRRSLLRNAGLGAAAAGAAVLARATPALAQSKPDDDLAILNFALNLEYLEAEFYVRAVYGHGLPDGEGTGVGGSPGYVTGGGKVPFRSSAIAQYALEIADDEWNHVKFLRAALGAQAVARPAINLDQSFTTLAQAAGIIGANETFSPFFDDASFLLGAFIFEDVGVTAYNGAGAAITSAAYLTAATSILAVEAYHAAAIRVLLLQAGLATQADRISALRGRLSAAIVPGAADDQGIIVGNRAHIVPTDGHSLAYARTAQQVLNIVYGGGAASN